MHSKRAVAVLLVSLPVLAIRPPVVPTPRVVGPIPATAPLGDPSRDYPFFSTSDLAEKHGYVEEEFFVEGLASAFTMDSASRAIAIPGGPYPYRTRVLVRRPRLASRFNGTAIVEWINAVAIRQYDFETDWSLTNEHLMRRGFVHVGASVQWFGVHAPVTGLKAWNPRRYASLDLTANEKFNEDELASAAFAQIAQVVKNPAGTPLLGSLRPRNIIATGQSASAGALSRYYNAFQAADSVIDGFVLHGAGGSLRTDIRTPVFKFMAETDVARIQAALRQRDSDYLRTWEVAGTSHLDVDILAAHDRLRQRDLSGVTNPDAPDCPAGGGSRIPARLVQEAVYDWMKRWVEGTASPPQAPPLRMVSIAPAAPAPGGRRGTGRRAGEPPERLSVVARDADGNALGGIRLAQFAVPTATNSGINDLDTFCLAYGSYRPFAEEELARRFPTRARFIAEVNRVTDEILEAGFITPEGAAQTKRDAAAWASRTFRQLTASQLPP